MKLLSIEPTPSPNSMKLNLSESLPRGRRLSYTTKEIAQAIEPYKSLLAINGVKSVFHTADFIALDRKPGHDWVAILGEARIILQGDATLQTAISSQAAGFGEAQVLVQMFRGIPIQLRIRTIDGEARAAMPARFIEAINKAAGTTMIRERRLEEFGVRYGSVDEITEAILQELNASYTDERLQQLIDASLSLGVTAQAVTEIVRPTPLNGQAVLEQFNSEQWEIRYAALDRYALDDDAITLLQKAIKDDNTSIRRLAIIYLGELKTAEVYPLLYEALKDSSASVRRTAGDTLSDLGDEGAIEPMIAALADKNKLVRWRAARFLYELGDERALPALKIASEDVEFEIKLQAQIAIERIERGEEAAGTVWQQMTAARQQN